MSDRQDETNDDEAEVVDFDALNAALGALPPPPSSSPVIAASEGRSNANYSSARPHRIPQSVAPNEDPLAPAVIIQADETIPSGPPVMTMPLGQGHAASVSRELARGSNPSHPFTPQPFPVPGSPDVNATLPMQAMPRPQRHPTLVLKPAVTQPSKGQKFVVFLSMLLVFVAAGIAFLVFYRPSGIRLDLRPSSLLNPTAPPAHPPLSAAPSAVPSATPIVSASAGALPEARGLSPSGGPSASAPAVASSTLLAPSALPSASATAPKKPKPRPPPAPVPTL